MQQEQNPFGEIKTFSLHLPTLEELSKYNTSLAVWRLCWAAALEPSRREGLRTKNLTHVCVPASPEPHPSKPHPCNIPQAETEVALQFSESCTAEVALQHSLSAVQMSLSPKAALQKTKNCTATLKSCVALSCRFPADFRLPRLGPHV